MQELVVVAAMCLPWRLENRPSKTVISNIMEMLFQIGYIVYIYNYIYAAGRSSLQPSFGLQMNHVFTFMQNLFCSLAIYNFPLSNINYVPNTLEATFRTRCKISSASHLPSDEVVVIQSVLPQNWIHTLVLVPCSSHGAMVKSQNVFVGYGSYGHPSIMNGIPQVVYQWIGVQDIHRNKRVF